jgi:hypothetical protein
MPLVTYVFPVPHLEQESKRGLGEPVQYGPYFPARSHVRHRGHARASWRIRTSFETMHARTYAPPFSS